MSYADYGTGKIYRVLKKYGSKLLSRPLSYVRNGGNQMTSFKISEIDGVMVEKKEAVYLRQIHRRQSSRRGRKITYSYYTVIGEKPEVVTKEDYDANIVQSKKDGIEAFMGRSTKEAWYEYFIQEQKENEIYNKAIDDQCSVRVRFNREKLIDIMRNQYKDEFDLADAIISTGAGLLEVER